MKISALHATTAGVTLALAANPTIQKGTRTGRRMLMSSGLIIPDNPLDQPSTCASLLFFSGLRARGVSADGVPHSGRRPTRGHGRLHATCLFCNSSASTPFTVDSTLNVHTTTLALPHSAARIYVILDPARRRGAVLSSPIPIPIRTHVHYNVWYIKTIDAFSKYDNVLPYNVGNKVLAPPTPCPLSKPPPAISRPICALFSFCSLHSTITFISLPLHCTFSPDPSRPVPLPSFLSPSHLFFAFADLSAPPSPPPPSSDTLTSTARPTFAMADYLSSDPSGAKSGATSIDLLGLNN
ncbi:hypothetical protein K438DRAFT_1960002 [Mycena galopus ATCC 62051]|nr:hypothetical protein K438DRAFT_1960002 [Mycena galopus ATCC 62051]